MMKKYIWFSVLCSILLSGLLQACEDYSNIGKDYTPSLNARYLYLKDSEVSFEAASNLTSTLSVEAISTPWRFSGYDASWLSFSPESGSSDASVSVVATENTSVTDIRTSTATFRSESEDFDYSSYLTISQKAAAAYIRIDCASLSFSAPAGTRTCSVESNVTWEVSSSQSWLTATPSEDRKSLTVSVEENLTGTDRSGKVTVYSTVESISKSVVISVSQTSANAPVASADTLQVAVGGGNFRLSVTSEVSWQAVSSVSWIQLTPAGGEAGTTAIDLVVAENPSTNSRTGYVYIRIGGKDVLKITVRQTGLYIEISPNSLSFTAVPQQQTLHVSSNTTWSVLSKPDWLSVVDLPSGESVDVVLSAEEYWGTSSRSGELVIGRQDISLTATVPVQQEGRKFDNLISSLSFDAEAASRDVTIETDGSWTAVSSDGSWLSVSPASGTGTTVAKVSVSENTGDDERSGTVWVTVGDIQKAISVTQQGKYFTLSPTSFGEISSRGGTHTLHIATNDRWTAVSSSTWMQLSATSGQGDIDVTMTLPDNPSIHARTDTTVFTPTWLQPVRVLSRQAGRYLNADVLSIAFFAKGGTSEVVTVTTDAEYSVTSSDPAWLTVSQTGNTFTVQAAENTGEEPRSAKVVIAMTGLNAGESYALEIPVEQKAPSAGINAEGFGEDADWDIVISSQATITVNVFSYDINWDN